MKVTQIQIIIRMVKYTWSDLSFTKLHDDFQLWFHGVDEMIDTTSLLLILFANLQWKLLNCNYFVTPDPYQMKMELVRFLQGFH